MYKHLFFDLDGTVTRSRSLIAKEMRETLMDAMRNGIDVIIVSGAKVEQAKKQTDNLTCFYAGQNGNHAEDFRSGKPEVYWEHLLTDEEKKEIWNHIKSIPRDWKVKDENDLVQDRGSQISYSLLGHNEILEEKEAFDPDFSKRKEILRQHPLHSKTVEVKIGGTTCLDYFQKGKNKGYNVRELIKRLGWKDEECVYVGDALFPGGNDETVVGVIPTHSIKDPAETLTYVRSILNSGQK